MNKFWGMGAFLLWSGLAGRPIQAHDSFFKDVQEQMGANETLLRNANPKFVWTQRAYVFMGQVPRGDATPPWWTPADLLHKTTATWNAVTPWFVLYPGVSHAATNVRVKIRDVYVYYLDKTTSQWVLVNPGAGAPVWASHYSFAEEKFTAVGPTVGRKEPDGGVSFKLDGDFHPIHGGVPKFPMPGDRVAAVFAQMTTELVLDNPEGVDDRGAAQILASVGVDYYYAMGTKVADYAPMDYNPGAGAGRFSLVRPSPRFHYFVPLDPPGHDNPLCPYVLAGGRLTLPLDQFRLFPPPHENMGPPRGLKAQ